MRAFILILIMTSPSLGTIWADNRKPAAAQEFAVVGGTVFRDNGLALADAEVTLEMVQDPLAMPGGW